MHRVVVLRVYGVAEGALNLPYHRARDLRVVRAGGASHKVLPRRLRVGVELHALLGHQYIPMRWWSCRTAVLRVSRAFLAPRFLAASIPSSGCLPRGRRRSSSISRRT